MKVQEVVDGWDKIVGHLRHVLIDKLSQYGTARYRNSNTRRFNLWMCFSDIYRKSLRLEELTYKAVKKNPEALTKLIDDYKDIANYAIMAVQILEQYDEVRTDSDSG